MAQVVCEQCRHQFEAENHLVTTGSVIAGATAGALLGSRIGIVAGPLGGIAGTIPGAVIGGVLAGLGASKVVTCPSCGHTFLL
jgi:hypothetical protein